MAHNPKYQLSQLQLIDLTEDQEKIIRELTKQIVDLKSENYFKHLLCMYLPLIGFFIGVILTYLVK